MTEQHPITPPPELMQEWKDSAQWGAEQKLEACINWVFIHHGQEQVELLMEHLRAASRPKPPSLKERALARLALLERLVADLEKAGLVPFHEKDDSIRLALEQLND
jgi:hypothetical protein